MPGRAPAVSIVMPVRDAAATLPATLRSIRRQTLVDFEIIAVDDGSVDGSLEVLRAEALADPRIVVLAGPAHGIVAALRAGLAAARAPLIARMDADDVMHPRRLEWQVAALAADPGLAVIAGQAVAFPRAAVSDGTRAYLAWQNRVLTPVDVRAEIYVEAPFVHPSVIIRRAALAAVGGYRDGPFPEDYDLWLRLHEAGLPMAKLPRVLLAWRESPGRATRTDPRLARERLDELRAGYLARDPRLRGRPLAIWGAGRRTRRRTRALLPHVLTAGLASAAAREAAREAPSVNAPAPEAWIDIDPRKVGGVVAGRPVVAPAWLEGRRPRPFVLVYVASHGSRPVIEARLRQFGYEIGRDALFVG
jgi:glycosyltransferase involved in cell wall biosynthesis